MVIGRHWNSTTSDVRVGDDYKDNESDELRPKTHARESVPLTISRTANGHDRGDHPLSAEILAPFHAKSPEMEKKLWLCFFSPRSAA